MFNLSKYKSDFQRNRILAVPIILGQLGQTAVNIADNLMVGKLGADALAAVSFATALFAVPFVLGMGISFALPPLVSEADGAQQNDNISRFFKHSFIVNVVFAIAWTAIIILCIPLLTNMGQDPEVAKLAQEYIYYTGISMIPFMIFQTFRCYSDGMSHTVPPVVAMIIGNILNVVLNYIFIFGKLGFSAQGVSGAALASLISRGVMVAILIYLLWLRRGLWKYIQACDFTKYQRLIFNKILNLGIPSSLQMFFEVSAFSAAAIIMGFVGKNEQAAHQIAISMSSITFMVCTGLAMASTIRVGNQLGMQNKQGIRDAGFSAIIQVIFIMFVFSVLMFFLRDYLPWLYISDIEVVGITASLLIYAAIFQVPDGVQVTALSSLRGIQDVKTPTIITFICYYIFGIPISYYTAINLGWGAPGVWLGLLVGLFLASTFLVIRFDKLTRLNIQGK